ncbi:MAG: hypothetical protein Q9159_000885 [Coniocarpon cinnabarinum]
MASDEEKILRALGTPEDMFPRQIAAYLVGGEVKGRSRHKPDKKLTDGRRWTRWRMDDNSGRLRWKAETQDAIEKQHGKYLNDDLQKLREEREKLAEGRETVIVDVRERENVRQTHAPPPPPHNAAYNPHAFGHHYYGTYLPQGGNQPYYGYLPQQGQQTYPGYPQNYAQQHPAFGAPHESQHSQHHPQSQTQPAQPESRWRERQVSQEPSSPSSSSSEESVQDRKKARPSGRDRQSFREHRHRDPPPKAKRRAPKPHKESREREQARSSKKDPRSFDERMQDWAEDVYEQFADAAKSGTCNNPAGWHGSNADPGEGTSTAGAQSRPATGRRWRDDPDTLQCIGRVSNAMRYILFKTTSHEEISAEIQFYATDEYLRWVRRQRQLGNRDSLDDLKAQVAHFRVAWPEDIDGQLRYYASQMRDEDEIYDHRHEILNGEREVLDWVQQERRRRDAEEPGRRR